MAKPYQVTVRLNEETYQKLTTLLESKKWNQAQAITAAIDTLYTADIPDQAQLAAITEKLEKLQSQVTTAANSQKKEMDGIRILCTEILGNQQAT